MTTVKCLKRSRQVDGVRPGRIIDAMDTLAVDTPAPRVLAGIVANTSPTVSRGRDARDAHSVEPMFPQLSGRDASAGLPESLGR